MIDVIDDWLVVPLPYVSHLRYANDAVCTIKVIQELLHFSSTIKGLSGKVCILVKCNSFKKLYELFLLNLRVHSHKRGGELRCPIFATFLPNSPRPCSHRLFLSCAEAKIQRIECGNNEHKIFTVSGNKLGTYFDELFVKCSESVKQWK